MGDDLPRSLYDGMDCPLCGGISDCGGLELGAGSMTCLIVGPRADNPRDVFKPLLSCLLRHTKRSWVMDKATILVQDLPNKAQVLLIESLAHLVHEFDLGGGGASWVGHWDEGGLPWRFRSK